MEKRILNLFTTENKLRFKDISNLLKERSNKVAYHLQNLLKKKILKKDAKFYSLADEAEYLIPYLTEHKSALPVILIEIKKENKILLYKRKKRPYINLYGLPGGRLIVGESISQGAKRIMKTKFNITIIPDKIKSITLEHIKKNNKIIHSFILIILSAKTKDSVELIDLKKMKKNIIKSDYNLIKEKSNNHNIKEIISRI